MDSPPPDLLASRAVQAADTIVRVGSASIGGGSFTLIAGPCAVESAGQLAESARIAKAAGATILRGGAFKPRASPYSFQGLGRAGLELLAEAGREAGLPVVTEVTDSAEVAPVGALADALQVGARNMHDTALLKAVAATGKPVILKRGLSARIEEWLLAAEYILAAGNGQVILCERGIRTFETAMRNTLDLAAVAWVKQRSHLPVIVDPSHGTGDSALVAPMALAALAAGADGVMIEVHPDPASALSDGAQALGPDAAVALGERLAEAARAFGKA